MHAARKNLLLINPWIYDFTAFDLWSKPLGLLYLASFLRQQGFKIQYIDCLDKYAENPTPKIKRYGIGNFRREIVEKPKILSHIPRNFARYGIAEDTFREKLQQMSNPDAVLVTSMMTYWYLGPQTRQLDAKGVTVPPMWKALLEQRLPLVNARQQMVIKKVIEQK